MGQRQANASFVSPLLRAGLTLRGVIVAAREMSAGSQAFDYVHLQLCRAPG